MQTLSEFELIDVLHHGDRTQVCRVRQRGGDDVKVIKLLNGNPPAQADVAGIRREFSLLSSIAHPNIIKAYRLGIDGGRLYLELEDRAGTTLYEYLQRHTPTLYEARAIARQLLEALSYLHSQNIIHKDIHPGNLLWDSLDEHLTLIDFNISSRLTSEQVTSVIVEELEGNLLYISPEQTGRVNKPIDFRSDFYSLGITLFELFTGRLPFTAADPMEWIHCHIAAQHSFTEDDQRRLPAPLRAFISKLMAKDPELRYQSATGAIWDFERCFPDSDKLAGTDFQIGSRDVSSRFSVPAKLYGREVELEQLSAALQICVQGETSLVAVGGYSGVGKSALIEELRGPTAKVGGWFIQGKSDQMVRNVPYQSLINAFDQLLKMVLASSDEKLQKWRNRILQAVGNNGRVLTDVMPTLEKVIGAQPALTDVPMVEEQNRFFITFTNFLRVFATRQTPVVLFLDDVQWSDFATLKLLGHLLAEHNVRHLLLVIGYRDNEVHASHPVMLLLDGVAKLDKLVRLSLKPIQLSDVNRLVAETLKTSVTQAQPVAELIYIKSQGNPFFVHELMQTLHRKGHFQFDFEQLVWKWDLERIRAEHIKENVVDFLVLELESLPEPTQQILKWASCIGNRFSIEGLALIAEQSVSECARHLWSALTNHYLVPEGENYRLLDYYEQDADVPSVTFRFAHDRILQAAYSLIGSELEAESHLRIARLLDRQEAPVDQKETLLNRVRHYNLGLEKVSDSAELARISQLNVQAGQYAQQALSYTLAVEFYGNALALIDESLWQQDYPDTYGLHLRYMESCYRNGETDKAELAASTILVHAKSNPDKARVKKIQMDQLSYAGKNDDAIEYGVQALAYMGEKLNPDPSKLSILMALLAVKWKMRQYPDLSPGDLPEIDDEWVILKLRIYHSFIPPAYLSGKGELFAQVLLQATSLVLKHGFSRESAAVLNGYQVVLSSLGQYQKAYDIGKLSVALSRKYGPSEWSCRIETLSTLYGHFWCRPHSELTERFNGAIELGLQTGDLFYTAMTCSWVHLWSPGATVLQLIEDGERMTPLVKQSNDGMSLIQLEIQTYFFRCLAKEGAPESIGLDNRSEEQLYENVLSVDFESARAMFYGYKMILNCIFRRFDQALEYMEEMEPLLQALAGGPYNPEFRLFQFLTLCGSEDNEKSLMKHHGKRVSLCLKLFRKWALLNPDFAFLQQLAEGEIARLRGDSEEAQFYYRNALKAATKQGHIRNIALVNELICRLYQSLGDQVAAEAYIKEAYRTYQTWGAFGKLYLLGREFGEHLFAVKMPSLTVSGSMANFPIATVRQERDPFAADQDVGTLLKVTRHISEVLDMPALTQAILQASIENVGAQKGTLVTVNNGQYAVRGVCQDGIFSSMNDGGWGSVPLPWSLLKVISRTLQPVFLDDAIRHPAYLSDDYIQQHQVRSFVGLPLLKDDKLVGILFLENNLVGNAFVDGVEQTDFLASVLGQAAVSLENALRFEALLATNDELESKARTKADEWRKLTEMDRLTQVYNRHKLDEILHFELRQASRSHQTFSLMLVDMDHFREINERYGYLKGDSVLRDMANLFRDLLPKYCSLGRWGGEEFLFICPNLNAEQMVDLAERLLNACKNYRHEGVKDCTLSIGTAVYREDDTVDQLINRASHNLALAKASGRNRMKLENESV